MTDQHRAQMLAQFNYNDFVKIRLTDRGRDVLARHGDTRHRLTEMDANGYTKFQLWELMNIFGSHIYNGCAVPFNPNILLLAPLSPPMTDQHRTTPEQWRFVQDVVNTNMLACLHELRARVEALEAAQRPIPMQAAERQRVLDMQEQIKGGSLTLAKALREISKPWMVRADGIQHGPPLPPKPDPASSLVERVASVLHDFDDSVPYHHEYARAAIREVAAWLGERLEREMANAPGYYDMETADDAIRWLREEATK